MAGVLGHRRVGERSWMWFGAETLQWRFHPLPCAALSGGIARIETGQGSQQFAQSGGRLVVDEEVVVVRIKKVRFRALVCARGGPGDAV